MVNQDPEQIGDAICQLLQSLADAHAMGEAGSRKARGGYSWDRLPRLTEEAYFDDTGATRRKPIYAGGMES